MKKIITQSYQEFAALSAEEQEREESIAIMVHDGGLSEDEARAIIEQRHISLFCEQN